MSKQRTEQRWQLNKAGVLNFWYYDQEEFEFADGKLLLRGSNGSGKSVTMQSLITVLLDGKKSPDRLDPFGSKARRMEDYLLGEKEVVDRDERTGYLYLEYKRTDSEQYITTGIGLKAKRHSPLKFWGFVILDNRRVNIDLPLYKLETTSEDTDKQKIPLSKRELENRLAEGGRVVGTQREYMELVNKYVFGFESSDTYEELIKLLIQLRSPKLSKDFKPTVIYEILNDSLPAISDDELRPLSDTIESMDQIKQQLEQLQREQKSLTRLCKQYDTYNEVILLEKAQGLLQADKRLLNIRDKAQQLASTIREQTELQATSSQQIIELEREQKVLQTEEEELKQHDVFRAERDKQKLEAQVQELQGSLQKKQAEWQRKQTDINDSNKKIDQFQLTAQKTLDTMEAYLEDLDELAELAQFNSHKLAANEFKKGLSGSEGAYEFDLWQSDANNYLQNIDKVLKVLREHSKIIERFQEAEFSLGESKKRLEQQEVEMQKWENIFNEDKQKFMHNYHTWQEQNQILQISRETSSEVAQRLHNIYEKYRFEQVLSPVKEAYKQQYQVYAERLAEKQQELTEQERKISEKEQLLAEWKAKKEPEPERSQATIAARQQLDELGIDYLPFFAAVEFRKEVTEAERERIEAAITQMGILDALIVADYRQLRAQTAVNSDKILGPQPVAIGYTLADYLEPTPTEQKKVSIETIHEVLSSIVIGSGVEEQATAIDLKGNYAIGIVQGHAASEQQASYIGQEARRQFRMREIEGLQTGLVELQQLQTDLQLQKQQLEREKQDLDTEIQALPTDDDLLTAYEQISALKRDIKQQELEVEQKISKVNQLLTERQQIRNRLNELSSRLTLNLKEVDYEEARQDINEYLRTLQKLELNFKDYNNQRHNIRLYEERVQALIYDQDEVKGEANVIEAKLAEGKLTLENIEQRLRELGVAEIRERIAVVYQRLQELPPLINKAREQRVSAETKLQELHQKLENVQLEKVACQALLELWQREFLIDDKRQLLGSVAADNWESSSNIMQRAKAINKELASKIGQDNLDREKVTSRLNNVFFPEQANLLEYRLTQENAPEQDYKFTIEHTEHTEQLEQLERLDNYDYYQNQLEQLQQKARRIVIQLDYNGQKVSPYHVLQELDKDLQVQKQLLSEKDQELYEEIIMNSVGRIIRSRIQRAQDWVVKINQLMQERDTSSGLTLSLKWKARTAEQDEEIDTEELVKLLRLDPKLLKDADLKKVTEHFRSKINRAKEIMEERGQGDTLHQMIKETLDYRRWFAFQLHFKFTGENSRELTNNAFYKFSGGEKAMAMYIPLLSAAYSRYMEARADAPFVITLDEAFAGVDEKNISDMFELVEKLGFNYIINSQVLWGDYDTVGSLTIAELVRPANASFVTVIHYRWDGKKISLHDTREELVSHE